MQAKVVGILNDSKKGYTVLHVIKDWDDWQIENCHVDGNCVDTLFIRKQIDCKVGDTVQVVYGVGYQGKAIVKDIIDLSKP